MRSPWARRRRHHGRDVERHRGQERERRDHRVVAAPGRAEAVRQESAEPDAGDAAEGRAAAKRGRAGTTAGLDQFGARCGSDSPGRRPRAGDAATIEQCRVR